MGVSGRNDAGEHSAQAMGQGHWDEKSRAAKTSSESPSILIDIPHMAV